MMNVKMTQPTPAGPSDPLTQMNTYRSYVTILADASAKDEIKLKAAQELSENFEVIITSPQYPAFLDHSMKIFLKILQEGEPQFIAEYNIQIRKTDENRRRMIALEVQEDESLRPVFISAWRQQVRKLILEMIHRLPTNDLLRPYVKQILSLMLKLLETENEENVLVCLRIIIELHKQYRPQYNPEIQHFLQFVKTIYKELPTHLPKIFEPRPALRVKDLSEINVEVLLTETFTVTAIQSEKKTPDGTIISYNLIPKAVLSLKVLQELPIIVVLMYQLYKQNVHQEVADYIPLIMTTITLQPSPQHRASPGFNKEVFVDFMGAQIKTLSFLAYIIRIYQEVVAAHANQMVKGMLGLLTLCPMEVAHLRKELLIAARHILATDLRIKFVPYMERLFDESVLLGKGWTTYESLRPLAYSTLADLVHHVRTSLQLSDLARAVHLFSKNVHDESLPTSIQTMSCKLLLNLVECIRTRSEIENGQGRELLMRMLEVFVLKFKTIAKLQLPVLMIRCKGHLGTTPSTPVTPSTVDQLRNEDVKPVINPHTRAVEEPVTLPVKEEKDKSKFGFPTSQAANYSVTDCRSLVKTLVCGVKTITWGCASCKNNAGESVMQSKQFQPKETLVFIRLVKWAMQALDIYTLSVTPIMPGGMLPGGQRSPPPQTVRTKEEKEVLEHFSGVFSMMNPQTFQEIFSTTIDYMVERIYRNVTLQIVGNSFLANPTTSPIFATVLVEYLLERMEEMGSNLDRSNLYLKLFKLVFGSVSLFPAENEHMLRPHLHQIVNRSMELAMSAKEPYNYFLLLRALFRSIGGGSHDLLYQEFLPLLPNLLQGLNSLQSGLHKQHMKDLFVELCLTVPVRLSSLLPYLPMLMDPLVSALNGSHTLISQGLRTLELCVDNLQPDFLYEHIQPVRADLMQALWRTLRNPTDQVAHVAFRVLGKFGGGNRKMMIEPQKLEYNNREGPSPAVVVHFQEHSKPIDFPVDKVIETAFTALKSSTTDPFYRRQSWEVIRCFLVASLNLDDDRALMQKLFSHPSFDDQNVKISPIQGIPYKLQDKQARTTHQTAVTGMFVAAAIKELRQSVLPTMVFIVSHYTMVAISQQAGPFSMTSKQASLQGMDPLVLIDSLAVIMGHEEKELCKPGHLALVLILETATNILGSKQKASLQGMDPLVVIDDIMGHEDNDLCIPGLLALVLILETATNILGCKEKACRLPLMEYLAEKMCSLCYERAWYAKLGGCIAIKFLFERMAMRWVYEHLFLFLKALLFVMMDLTGEVSSGAIDMAKANLEKMLSVCAAPVERDGSNDDLVNAQNKSLFEVTHELVRQVTSPNTLVREQAMHSLEVLARIQNMTVTAVMEPHKEVLQDMIPPKKHLLRHQPANAQIGIMDGNTFCTTLEPRLFTIDLNIVEHRVFFHELVSLCEADDAALTKLPCYKSVSSLVPLRKSALRALAACHYIQSCREKIFPVLYKAMEKSNPELQEAGYECMKKFIAGFQIDMEMVHSVMRPLLLTLGDYRNLSINGAKRLSYLTQLFSSSFNEKLCEQLLQHLKKLLEVAILAHKGVSKNGENEQKIAIIIGIFHQIPAATPKFIDVLCRLVLQTEKSLLVEASSPFREPLIKFLLRFPQETIDLFLSENNIKDQQWSRYLEFMIKHKDGKLFRDVLQNSSNRLISLALASGAQTPADKTEMQYQSIRITSLLIKLDDQWLSSQHQLVNAYKQIWCDDNYQETHKKVDTVEYQHWKEPKLLVKILLHFFCHHPNDIDLLFQLLRALCDRFIPDFQFLRDFLENTVAQNYTVEWKRSAFFRFVEHFPSPNMSQELKSKILQLVLIPCFAVSFERGEGEKLVGSPASPDQDNPDNVVSVFISKVIDPENPFGSADSVRILLLQFSCLLVEQASPHIHDAANKRQGNKLRRLMTFAWPCLLGKNCVDPATRYHGHLLLSHIIAKFAIHKRIVLQVFHSLLKAHAIEARSVVRQALEILTPSMPVRMEDGNTMLTHWTKKIIVEEGHSMQQLFHILQLVVRHYKVYYPVRHHLVQHMVNSMQRLGFSPTATMEHRKLAVELAEVIIKWELQRIKDENEAQEQMGNVPAVPGVKRPSVEEPGTSQDAARKRHTSGTSANIVPTVMPKAEPGSTKPIERVHADAVLNFLLRLACQVNDASTTVGSPGELLSRRCVALLKMAMKPDVWPQQCDLKLNWFDKVFTSVESGSPNYGNICTALELLTFLLGVMKKEQILASCKPLQRGIAACISSSNSKVIRLVHGLLSRLMSIFPTEPTNSTVASKYEELECLYASVGKVVFEGLASYEKNMNASPSTLFGTLMMLKAACINNPSYIDRLITPFMRVLQRMAKEHLSPSTNDNSPVASELLIVSLDLVKNRVVVMGAEMRKTFIGTILVGLIEKTPDIKVMKAVVKMLEDWMKNKDPIAVNQAPTLREKSILLVKLMQYVEKRFPDDLELNAQFLDIVNFIYRDETLKCSELTVKLEPAFLAGLRCVQPAIRAKFFEVFDNSMRRRLHDRLLYITCSQNWEAMGPYYWIKQCTELLINTTSTTTPIGMSSSTNLLPGITSVMNLVDTLEKDKFFLAMQVKEEPTELPDNIDTQDKVEDMDLDMEQKSAEELPTGSRNRKSALTQLIVRQYKVMDTIKETKTVQFLYATAQLCHMDTSLAERVWLDTFPKLWSILSDKQQNTLITEIVPFVCSGAHVIQKDCHPSALNTFVEAMSHCSPPINLKPVLMKYLGKSHNLWHRMTLTLEQLAVENGNNSQLKAKREAADCYDFEPVISPLQEIMDSLSDMYVSLCEEDMWSGLWQRHARYRETNVAIAYEQQGFFEQAQGAYEVAMSKVRNDYSSSPAPGSAQSELRLWEEHWIRCSKELNQWDLLLDYGRDKNINNPFLILESSWRVPDWNLMKNALAQVEISCPKEMMWKVHLYRGFLSICHPEDQNVPQVERSVEVSSGLCMREWRRLPHIVSHIHLPLLQAAQQIMELQEAAQIHQGFTHTRSSSLHDMKAIVKTWRNRLPVIADDLSHWSDIFTWRQHHYTFISSRYDTQDQATNHSMLGVHASAQAIIHFGKIARKHNLSGVCLDSLSRIYTIPSVPIVDCFQKIRQQVKCYLQMATVTGKNELQEGLEVIESTNLKYFTREMTAEFYALKGMLLAQIGRSEDANKAFSAAVQMHDTLVKAWALWGDYLEQLFTRDARQISLGTQAITCFLHACRHQNESKSRKYLAKVLWLLTYDDDRNTLTEAVDKYSVGVPPIQWLPWIPQLLTCLVRNEGKLILNLLSQVGRMFPQAVYFPIRTLYLTLKIEQRERYKSAEQAAAIAGKQAAARQTVQQGNRMDAQQPAQGDQASTSSQQQQQQTQQQGETGPIRATPSMWRCSRIMHMQRDIHPTVLSSLEGIVDQMVWFRENWYEEVARQLRQGLAKCLAIAFENRGAVSEATITPHTLNFVKKLVSTFGIGIENISNSTNATAISSAASESLASRARATVQDPVFQMMKVQFTTDFDFAVPGSMKLQNLIVKLRKWIQILETKVKTLPKSFLIEEKCRFLSNFSLQTAEVELPGEFLLPKHSHYYVRIARFMPRVDVVQKHNTAARRLYIRGHNGKIYPYLVVNDSGLGDARREERVLQLLRMLNHYLGKQKETSRRFLHFTVPRVVAVSPQMRLIEDNPASISLLDIYKQGCSRVGIEHDAPVLRYYERLAAVQARGSQASHQVLREILKEVQNNMVPRSMLRDWAVRTFPGATDYWTFRKMFTLQLSLACFAEYVLHLTRLNPDMMYIHQDSGLINVSYFKFDVDDTTGDLDANRPVPFRLTPNILEYLSAMGISGPLTASMIAAARCLVQPSFKVQTILRAILRDEMIAGHRKKQDDCQQESLNSAPADMEGELLINMVTRAVTAIMARLTTLSNFDGTESKVSTLVTAANSHDNLCRMDPAWHPWL